MRTPSTTLYIRLHTPHSLRDITDQFFHPPSPSPVRVSKLEKNAIEPPRRPKKPKSLAYPADPPNWLYSRSPSSLPPSSLFAFPPSDHATARYEYHLGTPSKASDSDPFGKTRAPTTVKSPPRCTIFPAPPHTHTHVPVPTNNEDIEGLYADEPVAGPSHVHVPVAPLLLMNSDQPLTDIGAQPTFPDPLRTPRKRKRRASPTSLPDEDGTNVPSSPSPIKVSVRAGTHRRPSNHTPVPKLTRYGGVAAVGARVKLRGTSSTDDAEDEGRMKSRSRSKANPETKSTKPNTRSTSKPKGSIITTTATTGARSAEGQVERKRYQGKGKARPLERVLDLSDDTREVRIPTMWRARC
ncbi:hypothetical protein OG21DRAFT_1517469 [Imleria badia]|nr:hypothetical protein OG21DRAFT_1517469 [Imleria badia]